MWGDYSCGQDVVNLLPPRQFPPVINHQRGSLFMSGQCILTEVNVLAQLLGSLMLHFQI